MSRAKLGNSELRFYSESGGVQTTKIKAVPTNNTLTLQGASAGTSCLLSNLTDPVSNQDAATKKFVEDQINAKLQGIRWKEPVVARTTANLAATFASNVITMSSNGALILDGITFTAIGQRVLVANQTTASENGLYTITQVGDAVVRGGNPATPAILGRSADGNTALELQACALFIEKGATYANSAFIQTSDDITLNTSNVVFEQFASFSDLLGGGGIAKVGNTFSIDVDNVGVELSAGKVAVKSGGISHVMLGQNVVEPDNIKANSITKDQLATDCIERDEIKNGEVIEAKLADNAVTETKIKDGEVKEDKLAVGSVTTVKIKDLNVTTGKLGNLSVTSGKIGTGEIKSGNIDTNAVSTGKIDQAVITAREIASDAVTELKILNGSVTTNKIFALNITEAKIAADAVTELKIKDNNISSGKLKSNSVTETKIAAGAITETKLANSSVTTSKIGTLSSLAVNGVITATSFIASGSGTDADGGFALPKSKSLSIDFNTDQTITGNDTFATVGGAVSGAGINFSYDDNITMSLTMGAFRINHSGTNNTNLSANYEISYYDANQNQLGFNDVSGHLSDFELYTPVGVGNQDFELSHFAVLGDGSARIASIRLRIKHDQSGDTVKVTDSVQVTSIAVDDTSGNTTKTYSNGVLS